MDPVEVARLTHAIGDWRIEQELGRGGMGVVYRAVRPDGTVCALKTVNVQERGLVEATHREIYALRRVVHPGIVRILDSGLQEGVPWYAMELLEGRLLTGAPSAAGTWTGEPHADVPAVRGGPVQPRPLDVALALCGPLAALHGAGLVHRDLKPDNVLVRDDGTLVITDFGLSVSSAGRDDLGEGRVAGTVAYMAPEQIRGEAVDARADLYALGCVLYELLTGGPPFVGPSEWVLGAHLADEPVPPSQLVDVAPGVDRLVLRLLAKSPRDRLPHAAEVARELTRLGARGTFEAPPHRPLLLAPLLGREDVLSQLSLASHRVTVLVGAAGSGKTRVARHLIGEASRADRPVFVGIGAPRRKALLQAAEQAFTRARLRDETRWVADRVAPLLGRSVRTAAAHATPLPPLDGPAETQRLLRAIGDLFEAFGGAVVILEDLDDDDTLTLAFLQGFATRPRGFAVVATVRDDAAILSRIRTTPGLVALALPPLAAEVMPRLAAEQLGVDALPLALHAPIAATGGNPLLLAEALMAWVSGHHHLLGDAGDLRRLVEARLDVLGPVARRVVAAVVVLGPHATEARVAAVAGVPIAAATDVLTQLLWARFLEDTGAGLRVVCQPLGRWLLERDDERVALHRAAAAALGDCDDVAALGHHLAAAGEWAAAVPWLLQAATAARFEREWDEAVGLYELALRGMPTPSLSRCDALREYAGGNRVLGRIAVARTAALGAVADARAVGGSLALAKGLMVLASLERTSDPELAVALLVEATQLDNEGHDGASAGVFSHLGFVYFNLGRYDDAHTAWTRALAHAEAAGDQQARLVLLGDFAMLHDLAGRLDDALAGYLEVSSAQAEQGFTLDAAFTIGNLAILHVKRNEFEQALVLTEQALATKRAYGYRRGEAMELMALANLHQHVGRFEEACRVGEESCRVFDDLGETVWSSRVAANLAEWKAGRRTPVV